jgi:hypothetical protein
MMKLADAHHANNEPAVAVKTLETLLDKVKTDSVSGKPEDVLRMQIDINARIARILQGQLDAHRRAKQPAASSAFDPKATAVKVRNPFVGPFFFYCLTSPVGNHIQ